MGDCDCLDRRDFLKLGLTTLVVSAVDPSFARAAGEPALQRLGTARAGNKTLIFVFQRFGADGLNVVVPVEPSEYAIYRSFRPTLAVDRTHPDMGPLDADFALNPLMKSGLHSLWTAGQLAVFPNVGYPNGSRSHFDSQLYIENGTPDNRLTADGWLNRYLQGAPPSADPLRAVALSLSLPMSMSGIAPAVSISDIDALDVATDPVRSDRFYEIQEQFYAQTPGSRPYDAELTAVGRSLIRAVRSIPTTLPAPTVAYPTDAFGQSMKQLAQLIRTDLFQIEVAEVDLPGWDTHADQDSGSRFPSLLSSFSNGITAFVNDLGPARMRDIVIVTASEFGRTARENGDKGTDHGSGWASFAIGGPVRGGVYFGPEGWHGLSDLREGRDLKHSIDFRDLFSEALARHLGTLPPGVFPSWSYTPIGYL